MIYLILYPDPAEVVVEEVDADELLKTTGLRNNPFGELNFKVTPVDMYHDGQDGIANRPIGERFPDGTEDPMSRMAIYSTSFTRIFYNELEDEDYSSEIKGPEFYPLVHLKNEDVGLPIKDRKDTFVSDNTHLYSDDLMAIRICSTLRLGDTIDKRITFEYDNDVVSYPRQSTNTRVPGSVNLRPFFDNYIDNVYTIDNVHNSTQTKRIATEGFWDKNYPPLKDNATAKDFFNYEYQRNRVSYVGRGAEVLFTLPNDLEYLKNYSVYKIEDLDLRVTRDSELSGYLSVKDSVHFEDILSVNKVANMHDKLSVKGAVHFENILSVNKELYA